MPARRGAARRWALTTVLGSGVALVLAGCGSVDGVGDADARADASVAHDARAANVRADAVADSAPGSVVETSSASQRLAAVVEAAKRAYNRETKGTKLRRETARVAADATLLGALARSDLAAAQAAARAQLLSASNHFDHVTRIAVLAGRRQLVNATLNSDGAFVVAPASQTLLGHGRRLGTLLVSIQDVTGFVKLVHRRTSADVVARGSGGQVRTSLAAAARLTLPRSGRVTVAGRVYAVASFAERAWGGEPLTVWVLAPT
jgi:hypothetical protein